MTNRLELARTRGKEEQGQRSVPMCKVDFASMKGHEMVSMVDVKMIKAKCQQLDSGCSVKSLLEGQLREERFARMCAPPSRCSSSPASPCSASARSLDCRVQQVRAKRSTLVFERSLRQLGTMRSAVPELALERFEALAQDASEAGFQAQAQSVARAQQGAPPADRDRAQSLRRLTTTVCAPQKVARFSEISARKSFFASCVRRDGFDLTTQIAELVYNSRGSDAGGMSSQAFAAHVLSTDDEPARAVRKVAMTRFELVMQYKAMQAAGDAEAAPLPRRREVPRRRHVAPPAEESLSSRGRLPHGGDPDGDHQVQRQAAQPSGQAHHRGVQRVYGSETAQIEGDEQDLGARGGHPLEGLLRGLQVRLVRRGGAEERRQGEDAHGDGGAQLAEDARASRRARLGDHPLLHEWPAEARRCPA
eukprot:CAMPEP_0198591152 /NCGR_PEP_ID=MMETSP1462-20131121/136525_1 /TAXON_ID=1333877 /ORGANISM="Brandtodinium nutriculum, Strain RCC3387" /LENGTH=419 /DNA_ID=CAMNT_0044322709 /DNA_START=12 /DNA_END=1266 /DNA_ORIENTATION=-